MQPLTPLSEGGVVMIGGFCTPFDLAILALTLGFFILSTSWGENYGDVDDENDASKY